MAASSCVRGSVIWGRFLSKEGSHGQRFQRSVGHGSVTRSSIPAPKQELGFHDRVREMRMAEDLLHNKPREILVVIGPKSSGKSALFEKYKLTAQAENNQSILAVDCRVVVLESPQDLGRELGTESLRLLNALPIELRTLVQNAYAFLQQLKISEKVADLTVALPELKSLLKKDVKSIGQVIEYLNTLLDANEQERAAAAKAGGPIKYYPVVMIDEANKLATWGDRGQEDLQSLLDWLVAVSKQKGQAHAVLVTSEFAFSDWLSERIPPEFTRVEVIGDFEEGDARSFFEKEVGHPVADAEWDMCFKILGGNAGYLNRCVGSFQSSQDMSVALDAIVRPIKTFVKKGARPAEDKGYTSAAFLTVARAVLAADGNRVPKAGIVTLLEALDPAANADATLLAMLRRNMVTVRPQSTWAFDIPPSAFGDDEELVMAPSAVHLHCWKMVLPPVIQAWEAKEIATKKAAASPGLTKTQVEGPDEPS